jgi:hypothetical protein
MITLPVSDFCPGSSADEGVRNAPQVFPRSAAARSGSCSSRITVDRGKIRPQLVDRCHTNCRSSCTRHARRRLLNRKTEIVPLAGRAQQGLARAVLLTRDQRRNDAFASNGDFFSSLLSCSLSRVQAQLFVSAAAEGAGSEERTAGDRTRRRRLNKLSCADWLPHDRGFVSGLPRAKDERRSGDRLITGQEGSPPRPCRRQCAPVDLPLSTSSRCCRRV